MKQKFLYIVLALTLVACQGHQGEVDPPVKRDTVQPDPSLAPACDYIKGGGREATGGRGGKIIIVNTLEDGRDEEGNIIPGSLREALQPGGGSRIILFDVAGTIHLKSPLKITSPNITIMGQSAPGDGICIADYPLIINATNVIVRFLRFRMGETGSLKDGKEYDAVSVNGSGRVVLDHLSCSWSVDECVSCYGNADFTMQYCFITESLKQSVHGKGNHGYGGIWGGKNVTFHHNLLAHHDSRNPRFDHDYVSKFAGPIDYVNNVVYNWGSNSAYGGEGSTNGGGGRMINFIGNYYKAGPASKHVTRLMNPWASCENCAKTPGGSIIAPHLYMYGNYCGASADVTKDNWMGVEYSGGATREMCEVKTRYTFPNCYTEEETAEDALETVLTMGGCCMSRDAIDERIVREVREGTYTYKGTHSTNGLIDTPSDVGGWPELKEGTPRVDTDGDGIPDEWETTHGLNPKKYGDAKDESLVPGYMNIEVYMNDIVKSFYK